MVLIAVGGVPQKLAVVELEAPDTLAGLASQVARQVIDAAQAQKWSVLTPEELRVKLDSKSNGLLKKCGGQSVCVSQFVSTLGVRKVVTGVFNRDEHNYLVKLWLIDVEKGVVEATIDRSILIASRRLQRDLGEAVVPFVRGEREAIGTVVIEANARDVQVFVNNEFLGVTPATLRLKPGKYELRLERKKYLPVQRFVTVETTQKKVEQFSLLLKPGEVSDKDDLPPIVAQNDNAKPIRLSAPTWIFGGLTVVALASGSVLGALSSQQSRTLAGGYSPDFMTYTGTRKQALEAERNATAANIAFGVAGGTAVLTGIFLVLDLIRKDSETTVALTPMVSDAVVGAAASGSF